MTQTDKKTVLVVEDDAFLAGLLMAQLQHEKINHHLEASVDTAWSYMQQTKPDLILLDLLLPGVDGFSLLERIKADPVFVSIPVIILSNLGQQSDINRGLKLGAKKFLVKAGYTPGEVVQIAKSFL